MMLAGSLSSKVAQGEHRLSQRPYKQTQCSWTVNSRFFSGINQVPGNHVYSFDALVPATDWDQVPSSTQN